MEQDLAGKTALVTGASRGLGSHIAARLAAAGALVAVNYASDRAAAEAVVAGIVAAGGSAFAVQAKLAGEAEAALLAGAVDAEFTARFSKARKESGAGERVNVLVVGLAAGADSDDRQSQTCKTKRDAHISLL